MTDLQRLESLLGELEHAESELARLWNGFKSEAEPMLGPATMYLTKSEIRAIIERMSGHRRQYPR